MVSDRSIRDDFREEFAFWEAYREHWRKKGIDIAEVFLHWAKEQAERLKSPGALDDFAELCNDGCFFQALAVIVFLVRVSPRLGPSWAKIVGASARRNKVSRDMEYCANLVDSLFRDLENEVGAQLLKTLGRVPPSRVAEELRFYTRFIKSAEAIKTDTRTHSATEVAKYLLTSYVERITRRPHDKNVAGIIAELTGKPKYGEVDQRMWRSRNYDRLDKNFSWITRIFVVGTMVLVFSE
jgi:hypothetical protein